MTSISHRLRVALLYRDLVIHDATLERDAAVTIGAGTEHVLTLEVEGLTEGFVVLQPAEAGYALRLSPVMRGRLQLGNVVTRVGACLDAGDIELEVRPGDWGAVRLGREPVWLFFQFVLSPEEVRRRTALSSGRDVLSRLVPAAFSVFGAGIVVSLVLQGALLFMAHYKPHAENEVQHVVAGSVAAPRVLRVTPTDVAEREEADPWLEAIEIEYIPPATLPEGDNP